VKQFLNIITMFLECLVTFENLNPTHIKILKGYLIGFPIIIIIGVIHSWLTRNDPSKFFINDGGDLTNYFASWIGAAVGAALSYLFFIIQKNQEETSKEIEAIYKGYVIRTVLFNLKDVFLGKKFERDGLIPDDESRMRFLKILNNNYIKKFRDAYDSVITFHKLAENHPKIEFHEPRLPEDHDPKTCTYCKDNNLIERINIALKDVKNPLLG